MRRYIKYKYFNLCNKYNLTNAQKKEIYRIIKRILFHKEFQRRFEDDFMHHGNTSLSEHILEDTIVTYKLSKKKSNINLDLALKISMMHDLYTLPWQNTMIKKNKFIHKHGFTHPIEAAINSLNWFKKEFDDEEKAKILIDGIVHHMYPLPVTSLNNLETNDLELNNYELLKNISDKNKELLIKSTNRNRIKGVSISKSKYSEGKIMSKADKKVSINQFSNIDDYLALVTGKNNSII